MPELQDSNPLPAKTFSWQLQGRIVAIDNGATLASLEGFKKLMELNSFAVISFDPASRLHGSTTASRPRCLPVLTHRSAPHWSHCSNLN